MNRLNDVKWGLLGAFSCDIVGGVRGALSWASPSPEHSLAPLAGFVFYGLFSLLLGGVFGGPHG